MFTADEFGDGGNYILDVLGRYSIKSSFFLTGNYLRDADNERVIRRMVEDGHYIGPHSDQHLLYCDWDKRDSLLVTETVFAKDLAANYVELASHGIAKQDALFFMPPYEWYNACVVKWSNQQGVRLVNFTPGLRTAADYTYPEMGERYVDSDRIYEQVLAYEAQHSGGLNGFIVLVHLGTDVRRIDKFYRKLPQLIKTLQREGYTFERIDELVQ